MRLGFAVSPGSHSYKASPDESNGVREFEMHGPTGTRAYRHDTTQIVDPATMGYYESKSTQVLKLAILLGLAESTELILKWEHIEFAIELLKEVKVNLSQVFLGVGRNKTAQLAAKLVTYLEMTGEACTKKRLYSVLFNDAPRGRLDIDNVIHHLVDTGKIHQGEFTDDTHNMKFYMFGTKEALMKLKRKLEDKEWTRTDTMNKLYLELSQFVDAKTAHELR